MGRRGSSLVSARFRNRNCWEVTYEISTFGRCRNVGSLLLAAPASAQGVKIGILNDQSGVYADYGGK